MDKSQSEFRHRWVDPDLDIDFSVLYDAINSVSPLEPRQNELTRGPWWLRSFSAEIMAEPNLEPFVVGVVAELHKLVKAVSPELTVALMELSLFHPDDPKGTKFFSFVLGPEASLVSYLALIEKNVSETDSRIPIIPNGFLYDSPFYTKQHERGYPTVKLADDVSKLAENTALVLIEYAVPPTYIGSEGGFSRLCTQIERTFDAVMQDILREPQNSLVSDAINADFSALIPLLRPAAFHDTAEPEAHERVRGGGLFLYGKCNLGTLSLSNTILTEQRVEPASFLLRPRHALLRGIMEVSYSKVDQDRRELSAAQSASLANAHEIRKFVVPIGDDPPPPPSMLKAIYAYFKFIFPIEPTALRDLLSTIPFLKPLDFAEKQSLAAWVSAAYEVAAVLAGTLFAIRQTRSEETFREKVNARLRNYLALLKIDRSLYESQVHLPSPVDWAFFGALVCAFRNTLEHSNFNEPIRITQLVVGKNRSYIEIRNKRTKKELSSERPVRLASSLTALSYYVNFYEKRRENSRPSPSLFMRVDQDKNYYLTRIPIPAADEGTK